MKKVKLYGVLLSLLMFLFIDENVYAGHTHSDSCYNVVYHTHSDGCYDITYHAHSESCYDIKYHTHTEACHNITYHTHTDSCYKNQQHTYQEQCTGWGSGGYEWNGQWYISCSVCNYDFCIGGTKPGLEHYKCPNTVSKIGTQKVLICTKTDTTVDSDEIICGKTEGAEESRTLKCGKNESTEESRTLKCGKNESTEESRTLICGKTESSDPVTPPSQPAQPTPPSQPAEQPAPPQNTKSEPEKKAYTYKDLDINMYVIKDVNVRDLPDSSGKKLGGLKKDEEVHITGQCIETDWYRFEYKNKVGYASDDYFTDNLVTVPEETVTVSDNVAESVPETEPDNINITVNTEKFDFDVYYKFVQEGLEVVVVPDNILILAEEPYSFVQEIWTEESKTLYTETGKYYIRVKNINGDIKTKSV